MEDDLDCAQAIKSSLRKHGMNITHVAGADEALAIFSSDAFDVVVSDIRLQGMNGIELLEAIRKRDAEFPVVLITAFVDHEAAMRAVKLGAADFILKPFETIEELVSP